MLIRKTDNSLLLKEKAIAKDVINMSEKLKAQVTGSLQMSGRRRAQSRAVLLLPQHAVCLRQSLPYGDSHSREWQRQRPRVLLGSSAVVTRRLCFLGRYGGMLALPGCGMQRCRLQGKSPAPSACPLHFTSQSQLSADVAAREAGRGILQNGEAQRHFSPWPGISLPGPSQVLHQDAEGHVGR